MNDLALQPFDTTFFRDFTQVFGIKACIKVVGIELIRK